MTGEVPRDVDGLSLLPFLADPSARRNWLATACGSPKRISIRRRTLAGRYEASGIIDEAAVYYELDPTTGWMQLREDRAARMLLARKQRAAISPDSLLAADSGPRRPGSAAPVIGPPATRCRGSSRAARTRPETPRQRRLWEALQARFPGELPPDPELP